MQLQQAKDWGACLQWHASTPQYEAARVLQLPGMLPSGVLPVFRAVQGPHHFTRAQEPLLSVLMFYQ